MKWYQRAVAGMAYSIGYFPTRAQWAVRMQHLNGEFKRSPSEWRSGIFQVAILVAIGGWFVGLGIWSARHQEPAVSPLFGILPGAVFLAGAIYFLRRLELRYVFAHGEVCALRANGAIAWRENLTGLSRVTATQARGGAVWIKLCWADRTRWMDLTDSLRVRLEEPVGDAPHPPNTRA